MTSTFILKQYESLHLISSHDSSLMLYLCQLSSDRNLKLRVRYCAFLVANVTKNFALATRISQLVASGRLATLLHATKALILSQIDQNKIQRHPPICHFLFTFPLLRKYKPISFYYKSTTMFYSYEECEASLPCFFSGFL